MKYFFVLGTNPTLSMAEICAVFPQASEGQVVNKGVFVLEMPEINAAEAIKRLGGTIKIGEINYELSRLIGTPPGRWRNKNYEELKNKIAELTNIKKIRVKFNFGFSYYGKNGINLKIIGMETKKFFKERGVSSRWVTSREPVLSSVVVEQNKLTQKEKGIEIILIDDKGKLLIGKTIAVQPFKELSFRDYGRPARDDRSGMLPPKLAQIMINLSRKFEIRNSKFEILLDPFCGSGTILTEAMLMGYRNLIGGDISKKAIDDTKKNIDWIKKQNQLSNVNCQLLNVSAAQLSGIIKANSVDAIVTEPYLGPQRGKVDIQKTIKDLENLYSKTLAEFYKILKPNGRAVMVWPSFVPLRGTSEGKSVFLNPSINNFHIINPIPEKLRIVLRSLGEGGNNKIIRLTPRNTIIYGREGQKIWREIVVLGK